MDSQVIDDMGNMLYYAPTLFGGDKHQGIAYIERAIQNIKKRQLTYNNWHYLNLMVTRARFGKEIGENEDAKHVICLLPNDCPTTAISKTSWFKTMYYSTKENIESTFV